MENNLSDYLLPLVKKYWLVSLLALCALIFFIYGMISFIGASQNSSQVNFDDNLNSVRATPQANLFAVDIESS